MTKSLSAFAADAATRALFEAAARLAAVRPGAYLRTGDRGTRLIVSNIPVPTMNSVSVDREFDLGEVGSFAAELSAIGLPWSIQVRGTAGPALKRLAERYGATTVHEVPLQIWDAESLPALPADRPEDTTVRKVSGGEAGAFNTALAAGYGVPEEVTARACPPAAFDAPGMTGYVLEHHGEVVATGFNITVDNQVGLYNGSVPPKHRGNGYYRALVVARLRDAVASGAVTAFAQNTPMSRPLYESLGFRLAETWTYLIHAG
jgi:GNAT superfamily N-acetyltransferase